MMLSLEGSIVLFLLSATFVRNFIGVASSPSTAAAGLTSSFVPSAKNSTSSMWSLGLLKTMKDPKYIVYKDPKIVMIKDMYPKAKHHFLVVPNEDISSIRVVTEEHVPLMEYMERKAKEYVTENTSGINFRYGYHAQPSMQRLHLHVISDDMISDCLKTKRHWNSFNSEFFMPSKDVIRQLKEDGKVSLPTDAQCDEYLKKDLKCHRCDTFPSNMPKLKQHILIHDK